MSLSSDLPASAVRMFKETRGGPLIEGKYLQCRATWRVAAADLYQFMQVVGGLPQTINGVTRIVPLLLDDPQLAPFKMYASDILDFQGIGHNHLLSPQGYYTDFFVTVQFRQWGYLFDGSQALMQVDFDEGQRILQGPATAFQFASSNPAADLGVALPTIIFRVTMFRLPSLNYANWANLSGFTNNAAVPLLGGVNPGYLLYHAPTASGQTNLGGQTSYQITHVLEFSPIPWNYEINPAGVPALVTYQGGAYRYPLADFSILFN